MENPVAEHELLRRLLRSGASLSSSKAVRAPACRLPCPPFDLPARLGSGPVSGSLYACNCPVYLHYAWCEHACAKAVLDGVLRLPSVSSS
eukprot:3247971-Rhodomonas_salina.1